MSQGDPRDQLERETGTAKARVCGRCGCLIERGEFSTKVGNLLLCGNCAPPRFNELFSTVGIRHDEGKPRFDLIPPDALFEVAKVFTEGAKIYADRNWEKGMKWNKHFAAMQRHLWKWESGNSIDEESGLNHLAHAAFGCLALLAYELRKIGEDDRPKAVFSRNEIEQGEIFRLSQLAGMANSIKPEQEKS